MSDYDAEGEIAAVRMELANVVDHQARSDQRLTSALTGNFNTMDRLSVALGRLSDVERTVQRIEKIVSRIAVKLEVQGE